MEQVIVDQFGAYLSKKSERLVVKAPRAPELRPADGIQLLLPFPDPPDAGEARPAPLRKGTILAEIPFFRICEILVTSRGVSLSTDLIEECCRRGIRITLLAGSRPFAMLSSPMLTATVQTRREQMQAYLDERGFELARAFCAGKVRNQIRLLRYYGKYLKEAHPDRYEQVASGTGAIEAIEGKLREVQAADIDSAREVLMGLEGTAARVYWSGIRCLLEGHIEFSGREHRGAADPVNASLNYGYGILYSVVWGAILNAGLEPFAGFLHVDRPGKPSLVLDMTEEFRAPVVDRAVVGLFTRDQKVGMAEGLLDAESRKLIADRVKDRLSAPEPYRGAKYQVRSIIQAQARRVAVAVRREGRYEPFGFTW
ncbi:MAG: CRISPR-associated endonuclease Cas1 [Nitrospirae bacterium]|nr:CRISPR-associated endonuclease Cas1 [Nitrospirota bacterium]